MYEAHFGLKARPFGSKAEGSGVFVGPQQSEIVTAIQKGLSAQDAIVTVTGAVGTGKTTIVSRALDTISPNRMVAWMGRMPVAPDQVLRLLLAGFGAGQQAKGTIQRFAAFRRLLAERAAAGAQVAIVVEDAHRIGVDALNEIEVLTAADTGDGNGGNVVLMGQPNLHDLLSDPNLARLKQRIRRRQNVLAFSRAEVQGYLKHCIRDAGGDFDKIFEAGTIDVIYECSDGIPRVINTLCDTALAMAGESASPAVSATLMHQVAVDEFGFDGPLPDMDIVSVAGKTVVEPKRQEHTNTDEAEPQSTTPEQQIIEADSEEPAEPATQVSEDSDPAIPESARNLVVESGVYPDPGNAAEAGETKGSDSGSEMTADLQGKVDEAEKEGPELSDSDEETQRELTQLTPQFIEDTAHQQTTDNGTDSPPYDVIENAQQKESQANEITREKAPIAPIIDAISENELPELIDENEDTQRELTRLTPAILEKAAATIARDVEPEPAQPDPIEADPSGAEAIGQNSEETGGNEDLDLDDALSLELDTSNVMRGMSQKMGEVAAQLKSLEAVKEQTAATPSDPADALTSKQDELPTLSDSMRVNVGNTFKEAAIAETETETEDISTPEPRLEQPADESIPTETVDPSEDSSFSAPANTTDTKLDVDALEQALADNENNELELLRTPRGLPVPNESGLTQQVKAIPTDDLPDISLDDVLPDPDSEGPDLSSLAADIGKASSLEDMDDAMAETLFGSQELDHIAAAVVANPPSDEAASPVKLEETELPTAANDAQEFKLELEKSDVRLPQLDNADARKTVSPPQMSTTQPKPQVTPPALPSGDDLKESVAMRIDMLNAMKNGGKPPVQPGNVNQNRPAKKKPEVSLSQPESIEEQINTSITQTLKALKVPKASEAEPQEDEEEEEKEKEQKETKSGGLFSRFRKSS